MRKGDLTDEENFDDIIRAPEICSFNYQTLKTKQKKSCFWLKILVL